MGEATDVDQLTDELMELRRGHGLFAADSADRAGPLVRRQCGVRDGASDVDVRHMLLLHLSDVSARLPGHVRPVVEAALALHPQTRHRYLHERMQWAAHQLNRDHPRTAHRRLEHGFRLLSELLLLTPSPKSVGERGWHTIRLDAYLRMDLDPPVLTERRTVRALVDDFDELTAQLSAPQDDAGRGRTEVRAKMDFGGEIVEQNVSSRNFAAFVIRFPEPLQVGEEHTYSVEFAGPSRAQIRPYYVLTPYRRCDQFSLRVKFPLLAIPDCIWVVDGMPSRRVDEFAPTDKVLHTDPIGEITMSFDTLLQGLSYGVQWSTTTRPRRPRS